MTDTSNHNKRRTKKNHSLKLFWDKAYHIILGKSIMNEIRIC